MEEILALQRELQAAQMLDTAHRLSDRNTVEIILKLISMERLKLIYGVTGKEYVTHDKLKEEIKDELRMHGGRVSIVDLPATLGVNTSDVEDKVNLIIKESEQAEMNSAANSAYEGGVVINLNGIIMNDDYMDGVVEEINEVLEDAGQITITAMATRFMLPTPFLTGHIEKRLGTTFRGRMKGSELYTESFVQRHNARVKGAFLAITTPTSFQSIVMRHKFMQDLAYTECKRLITDSVLSGSLKGVASRAMYVPSIYLRAQEDAVKQYYTQHGYIEYDRVGSSITGGGSEKTTIANAKKFLRLHFPDATALGSSWVSNAFLAAQFAMADEDMKQSRSFVNLAEYLPESMDDKDTDALCAHLLAMLNEAPNSSSSSSSSSSSVASSSSSSSSSSAAAKRSRKKKQASASPSGFASLANNAAVLMEGKYAVSVELLRHCKALLEDRVKTTARKDAMARQVAARVTGGVKKVGGNGNKNSAGNTDKSTAFDSDDEEEGDAYRGGKKGKGKGGKGKGGKKGKKGGKKGKRGRGNYSDSEDEAEPNNTWEDSDGDDNGRKKKGKGKNKRNKKGKGGKKGQNADQNEKGKGGKGGKRDGDDGEDGGDNKPTSEQNLSIDDLIKMLRSFFGNTTTSSSDGGDTHDSDRAKEKEESELTTATASLSVLPTPPHAVLSAIAGMFNSELLKLYRDVEYDVFSQGAADRRVKHNMLISALQDLYDHFHIFHHAADSFIPVGSSGNGNEGKKTDGGENEKKGKQHKNKKQSKHSSSSNSSSSSINSNSNNNSSGNNNNNSSGSKGGKGGDDDDDGGDHANSALCELLHRHLLKSLGRQMVDLILKCEILHNELDGLVDHASFLAIDPLASPTATDDNKEAKIRQKASVGYELNPAPLSDSDRMYVVSHAEVSKKHLLEKLTQSLQNKSSSAFLSKLDGAFAASDIWIKKSDKKKERALIFNLRNTLMTQLKDIASIHAPAGAETHPEAQLDRAAEEDEASASAVVVLEDCLMTLQYTVVILYSKLSNHLIHAPYRAVGMALEAMYEHAKMNLDKWQLIADYKAELDQFRMAQKTQPQRDDRERIAQNQRINRLAGQVKAIGLNPLSAMQKK